VPAVNIGTRQHRRVRADNVIDVAFEKSEIVKAVKKATSKAFREHLKMHCRNPYGDGRSSERILDILLNTPINDNLLTKRHVY
ncbi:MAG: UDP-N-acetylglucosamine 2-epimerase, partial [Sedimentisphaerales bacterium]|nr:UDP-N-acetylglucosamine 2-epimerase [Sedimentisphaerales bacterium]